MRNAILYRGCWLMSGSVAHRLHTEAKGNFKLLDAHLKRLDEERRQRGESL